MAQITTTIPTLIWPVTADGKVVFNQKSDALPTQLDTMSDNSADFATEANALRDEVNSFQLSAASYAVDAANQVTLAENQVALAEGFRDEAEGFRDDSQDILDSNTVIAAAVQSAAGLPSLSGNAGKTLVVNDTEDGVEWGGGERLFFTKSFALDEEMSYTLSGEAALPIVSVTKEAAITGETNNDWDVDAGEYEQGGSDLDISSSDINLSVAESYLLSVASYDSVSFSVAGQDTTPQDVVFNSDGTKMFIVGSSSDAVHQYTLTTGFDLSTASYDSVSFSVAGQDTTPRSVKFNSDGTKMFITGSASNAVHQYTLTTGFDLSTASYASVSFSVAGQETSPTGLTFSLDGSKMFIVGINSGAVYQYTLTTGFDLSTASYDSASFSVTGQDATPFGLAFNGDGSKMFIVGNTTDTVYQYSLTTGFDLTTASYDSVSFDVSGQDSIPLGLTFSLDGSKMFIVGSASDYVHQYSTVEYLTNEYYPAVTTSGGQINTEFWTDLNTLTADETLNNQGAFYALSTDSRTIWQVGLSGNTPRSIVRNNAGTWEYNSDASFTGETWTAAAVNTEYDALSEAMDIIGGYSVSSASYDSVSFSVAVQDAAPRGLSFNDDGAKMFVIGAASDSVHQYTLTTGFDVSTASYDSVSFSVAGQAAAPTGLIFNNDGTKMFVIGETSDSVHQYTLTTGFDLSTTSYDSVSFSVSGQEINPTGLTFNTDGTKMFIVGFDNDTVYQYTLTTGFDLSTASYDSVSFSVAGQEANPQGLAFSATGDKMFIVGITSDSVYQYTLTTGFDLSTASYDSVSFSVSGQDTSPQGLVFNSDGTKMFVVGESSDAVHQYTTEFFANQMPSTQLVALTTADLPTLTDTLDLAVVLYSDNAAETPVFSGMEINYTANVRDQVAIAGTDYEWWSYGNEDIRFKALTAGNFKGRVL